MGNDHWGPSRVVSKAWGRELVRLKEIAPAKPQAKLKSSPVWVEVRAEQ